MNPLELSAAQVEQLGEAEAAEVINAWVKAKQASLPEALVASKSKVHARLAKKALYQLKSSGVAVEPPKTPMPVLAKPPEEEFLGVLSAIVGTGERAVFFGRPARAGMDVFQGVISDDLGILQLDRSDSTRSTYRRRIREIETDADLKVLLVPFARVLEELAHAYANNGASGTAVSEDTAHALRRLQLEPATTPRPPLPAVEAGDAAFTDATPLHATKEIAQWFPSEAALAVFTERIGALPEGASPDVVNDVVRSVANESFTSAVRQLYARRLWAMAELFAATDRATAAAHAKAEARLLFHSTQPSSFAFELFRKVLAIHQEAAKQKLPAPSMRLPPMRMP